MSTVLPPAFIDDHRAQIGTATEAANYAQYDAGDLASTLALHLITVRGHVPGASLLTAFEDETQSWLDGHHITLLSEADALDLKQHVAIAATDLHEDAVGRGYTACNPRALVEALTPVLEDRLVGPHGTLTVLAG